jgi:hypothetical protein
VQVGVSEKEGYVCLQCQQEGTQHVIVGNIDLPINPTSGIVTELYWKSGQGVKQDVLIPYDGETATAFYSADNHTQHVVVAKADGTLIDVHWQSGKGIHSTQRYW